ncbi:MAG TPA: dTMP kinase [Candidatus Sulfotelmatobacter sp.]|nr:dTMP kinase [Candidatus Sulfotelmatobacter sp.]
MFIAVDGIDGSGKTTLVAALAAWLRPLDPVATKEPTGSSEWGRRLRDSAVSGRLPKATEIEYFHRDRLQHLADVIRPALAAGRPVITDRYIDSLLAFQAEDLAEAERLYARFAGAILLPDVTFILDCPVATGLSRIARNRDGRSTFETDAFLERARRIYQSRQGGRYVHLDATRSADAVLNQARAALQAHFPDLARQLATPPKQDR